MQHIVCQLYFNNAIKNETEYKMQFPQPVEWEISLEVSNPASILRITNIHNNFLTSKKSAKPEINGDLEL